MKESCNFLPLKAKRTLLVTKSKKKQSKTEIRDRDTGIHNLSGNIKISWEKWRENGSHHSAPVFEFLSQDINEEMTHTCKEKEKKEGGYKEGVRDVGFRGMKVGD